MSGFDEAQMRGLASELGMDSKEVDQVMGVMRNMQMNPQVQNGVREHDAETRSAIMAATAQMGPDVQKSILESSKEEAVVGAQRCLGLKCQKQGTLKCSRCTVARYCSKECQKSDWKEHRKLAAKRVVPFKLRVEDEYCYGGRLMGTYLQAAYEGNQDVGEDTVTFRHFTAYYQRAKKKGMFPSDWTASDRRNLMEKALDASEDWACLFHAVEKGDIVEKWGYASNEHMVLHRMAENVMGPIGSSVDFLDE